MQSVTEITKVVAIVFASTMKNCIPSLSTHNCRPPPPPVDIQDPDLPYALEPSEFWWGNIFGTSLSTTVVTAFAALRYSDVACGFAASPSAFDASSSSLQVY